MANEIRIYGIDHSHETDTDIELDYGSLTNDEFMAKAEEQGFVWTLEGFQNGFNEGEISDELFIRILNVQL